LPVLGIDEESSSAGSDSALPAALQEIPNPPLPSPRERSVTVLDVHPPHENVHSWKSFFIHIATIVVGLFIAVAIEQTVEAIHHRSESKDLQEQMRTVFETNLINDRRNMKQFATERAYLTELRAAIDARLHGQTQAPAPPAQDPRIGATMHVFPSMAPYDAAKQNGTIALLPFGPLSIYNRVDFQRQLLLTADAQYLVALRALSAFEERFADSTATLELGQVPPSPDLALMDNNDLREYLAVLSTVIKDTDTLASRYQLFDSMNQVALTSPRDETELVERSLKLRGMALPQS
jgi:hypothetical protein